MTPTAPDPAERIESNRGGTRMDFIQTIGYDIALGKAAEYQQWFAANEDAAV